MKNRRFLSIIAAVTAVLCLVSCSAGDGSMMAPTEPDLIGDNNRNDGTASGNHFVYDAAADEEYIISVPNASGDMFDFTGPAVADYIENAYVNTSEQPTSTFSADIDTASYTYLRTLIANGCNFETIKNNVAGSIRTEEMVNYFKYDYAEPGDGEVFSVKANIIACPWSADSSTRLLRIGLKAKSTTPANGNNLVFLIDVSGSMRSENKLPLLQSTFSYLTEQLGENDVISIVTYSGEEKVVLDGCSGKNKQQILNAIGSLKADGATNGEAGLSRAYELAKAHYIEGGNNRIIMASDGDLNVGISSPEALKAFVTDMRESGVYLSVLGFGNGNYRDANMEALADNGNGVYYYIDSDAEAEKVFCTDLTSTLYTVAEDVKLQLSFDPQYISAYRLVGYENRVLNNEDFTDDTKDAGEVGAGCTVTVCYELRLTEAAESAADDTGWLKLSVRHKEPGESESRLHEYSFGRSIVGDADDELTFICAVIETSLLIHNSRYLSSDSQIGSISDVLTQLSSCQLNDSYKQQFVELLRELAK